MSTWRADPGRHGGAAVSQDGKAKGTGDIGVKVIRRSPPPEEAGDPFALVLITLLLIGMLAATVWFLW